MTHHNNSYTSKNELQPSIRKLSQNERIAFGQTAVLNYYLREEQCLQTEQPKSRKDDLGTLPLNLKAYSKKCNKIQQEHKTIQDALSWPIDTSESAKADRWMTEHKDKYRCYTPERPQNEPEVKSDECLQVDSFEQCEAETEQTHQIKHAKKVHISNKKDAADQITTKTSTVDKQKKKVIQLKKTDKQMEKRRTQFNSTTRWLPDTAFTTYLGKPAFHPYGRGNTKPTAGGINYGQNMLTHNINPECGAHLPKNEQVYEQAMRAGVSKTKGLRVPSFPIFKELEQLDHEQTEQVNNRSPIMPKPTKKHGKPPISIAKPEMTLTGFKHSEKILNKKANLNPKTPQKPVTILAKKPSQFQLQSRLTSKKHSYQELQFRLTQSSLRASSQKRSDGIMEDDIVSHCSDFVQLPLNQEIDQICANNQSSDLIQEVKEIKQEEKLQNEIKKEMLDPRNYAFVSSKYTQKIRPAGQKVIRSETIGALIHDPLQNEKSERDASSVSLKSFAK